MKEFFELTLRAVHSDSMLAAPQSARNYLRPTYIQRTPIGDFGTSFGMSTVFHVAEIGWYTLRCPVALFTANPFIHGLHGSAAAPEV